MSKEAMKLGLEALEDHGHAWARHEVQYSNAMIALREALAEQPAPEASSVAEPIYQCQDSNGKWTDQEKHSYDYNVKHGHATVRVVYLAPQPAQRRPLSVDEIFEAIRPLYSSDKAAWLAVNHSKDEYRAIEAAHGIGVEK